MKTIMRQGVRVVITIAVMLLLLLGSAAPFGQDEPDFRAPTPTIVQ